MIADRIYEILQNVADSNPNLSLVNNTRGENGYPKNVFCSIIDSSCEMNEEELDKVKQQLEDMLQETIEQCTDEDMADALKKRMVACQFIYKRDGWNLWSVWSDSVEVGVFDMYEILKDTDNDVYMKTHYGSEEEFIDQEVRNSGILDGCDTFDGMEDILAKMRKLWGDINSLEDGEILVGRIDSWYFEKIKRFVTKYNHDSHTCALAFSII